MRKILIIGIGAGNPDYLTVQAINALNQVDVFFIPDKGAEKAALRRLREEICERFIRERSYRLVPMPVPARANGLDYRANVNAWHEDIAQTFEGLLAEELGEGQCGGFLVWGDPTLYDSTLRIIDHLARKGCALECEVIPGISSVQALAARHRVTLNRIGEPLLITTGRKLGQEGFPNNLDSIVVMLDGEQAFTRIDASEVDIFWGAYVGTEDEILVAGKLSDVMRDIERIRREARERNGWIMDTYLLRKGESA